jgi:hypothetical protein
MSARFYSLLLLASLAVAALTFSALEWRYASADDLPSLDAGAAAPTPPPAPCLDSDGPGPAPCVASPLDSPRAYLDTAATAKREGWALLIGVLGFGALVIASRKVKWLSVGWRALAVSGAVAAGAAAINAAFMGGSWTAMLYAAGGAAMLAWQGDRTVAAQVKAAKAATS